MRTPHTYIVMSNFCPPQGGTVSGNARHYQKALRAKDIHIHGKPFGQKTCITNCTSVGKRFAGKSYVTFFLPYTIGVRKPE